MFYRVIQYISVHTIQTTIRGIYMCVWSEKFFVKRLYQMIFQMRSREIIYIYLST